MKRYLFKNSGVLFIQCKLANDNSIFYLGLFDNLQIEIDDDNLKQLFHDIDIDSNNHIEYNELMNYIRQAKVERTKI